MVHSTVETPLQQKAWVVVMGKWSYYAISEKTQYQVIVQKSKEKATQFQLHNYSYTVNGLFYFNDLIVQKPY